MFDLTDFKNDTARKKFVREKLAEIIKKALIEEFGEENVCYVPKAIYPNDSGKIDSESGVVSVADIQDKDGFTVDLLTVVSPQIKPFNTVMRKDGKTTPALCLDDVREAVETIDGAKK